MRAELLNPVANAHLLQSVTALVDRLYQFHEAGRDHSVERQELAALVGKPVSKFDVDAAFGSIEPQAFALGLMPMKVPVDLPDEEMLEMIQLISTAKGTTFQINYRLQCLKAITKDDRLSDLNFWPDEYFAAGNAKRRMSPREILETAMAAGRRREPPSPRS